MRRIFLRWNAITRNVGSNAAIFASTIVFQILTVPVLVTYWGSDFYGVWIMVSTVPVYIAACDIGLSTAATGAIIEKVSQQDRAGAGAIFFTVFAALFSVAIMLLAAGLVLIHVANLIPAHGVLAQFDFAFVVSILLSYGAVGLIGTSIQAGFRALNLYATGTMLLAATMFVEGLSTIVVALTGGSLVHAAIALLIIRVSSVLVQGATLLRLVPWLRFDPGQVSRPVLLTLLRPALAASAMPLAQAIYLQGVPLVIGFVLSPAMVANFSVIRTLSRLPLQVLGLFNHAILPSTAKAYFERRMASVAGFIGVTIATSFATSLLAAISLYFFGPEIIYLWTNNRIVVDQGLLCALIAVMAVNILWHPLSNMLLAINRAAVYAPAYLVMAPIAILGAYAIIGVFGLTTIVVPLLFLELVMLVVVIRGIARVFFVGLDPIEIVKRLRQGVEQAVLSVLPERWRRV